MKRKYNDDIGATVKIGGYKISLFIVTLLLVIYSTALSQPSKYRPTGFVNDFAGIINPDTKSKLEALLTSFEKATSTEVSVVTVPSLDEITVEDYATRLFEQWGIGKKEKDNGLLILVSPTDKKMRIEAGYGLEGAINDATAGRIIRDVMIPWFKKGDYSTGILNGTVASIEIVNKRYNMGFDPATAGVTYVSLQQLQQKKASTFSKIFRLVMIGIFILIFIKNPFAGLFLMMGLGGGRSGGFRGSGFGGGGGFGGFGGGLSGGGGASGSW